MAIRHDTDKTWIDNVRGFSPCEWVSSVHGAQARILQALGEPLGYDDLVCYGAFAFRACIHDEMCPSAGHPCCGFDTLKNSNEALGWNTRFFDSLPWSPPKPNPAAFEAQVCDAIRVSINRGIPVHYGSEEDGLIIGYADGGSRWWCVHPYYKNGAEGFWHDQASGFAGGKWPWGVSVWVERKPANQRTAPRQLTIDALRQAILMWNAGKRDKYFLGDAAYEHWLGWLGDVEAGRADAKKGMHGNAWCFDVLTNTRRIAGDWLKQRAEDVDAPTAAALREAAGHFARIPEICLDGFKTSWDLAMHPNRAADWTSDLRQRQIARLEAAREHDRAAIEALASIVM